MPDPSIVGIGSALIGASSASKAAKAQEAAAARDIAFQTETRDLIRADLDPYRQSGNNALAAYNYELGLGDRPTFGGTPGTIESYLEGGSSATGGGGARGIGRPDDWANNGGTAAIPGTTRYRVGDQSFDTMDAAETYAKAHTTGGTEYGGYQKTPGYDYRMQEGQNGVEASLAARGGLNSGNALRALQENGQNFATAEYGNYMARLQGQQGVGLSASAMNATAAQNTASGVSNALGGMGNAQAAGAIGVGNAITGGIGNVLGAWNYQKQQQPASGGGNWMFGGNSFGNSAWGK